MTNFKDVADRITRLQEKKNNDYGNAFAELCEEFGSIALVYPLQIKIRRLTNLLKTGNQKVSDEALTDTLLDIMGYAGMGIMALENGQLGDNKPEEEEEDNELEEAFRSVAAKLRNCFSYYASATLEEQLNHKPEGKVILLVGDRGAGKTTLKNAVIKLHPDKYAAPVSITTRKPREGEVDGKDYIFMSPLEFYVNPYLDGDCMEVEVIGDDIYASLKKNFDSILDSGKNVITEVGLGGAEAIKEIYGDKCSIIFINCPSSIIKENLEERGEDKEFIRKVLVNAYNFLEQALDISDKTYNIIERKSPDKYAESFLEFINQ